MKKSWLTIGLIAALSVLIVIALVPLLSSPSEPEYHGKKLTAWIDDLDSPLIDARSNATSAIQQMGTNAVPFLIEMLHVKDSPFKSKCRELLARQHWIHSRMRDDSQAPHNALRALAILGPDANAASPDLAEILLSAGATGVDASGDGSMAGYTLSEIGPSSLPVLKNALTSSNELARGNAAVALGALGDPSCVPNLLAALKDPERPIRYTVAAELSNFPGQANVIVPALIKCLDDPDCWLTENAATALGRLGAGARAAIPKLSTMTGSTNCDAGQTATEALLKIDYAGTLATFTNNLESSDANVRRTAAWALMFFQSQGAPAAPFLVKCLKDPDAGVRDSAAIALWKIGEDPDVIMSALIEGLDNADGQVRHFAAVALGGLGARAKPAVPQILRLMKENNVDPIRFPELYGALNQIDPAAAVNLKAETSLTRH